MPFGARERVGAGVINLKIHVGIDTSDLRSAREIAREVFGLKTGFAVIGGESGSRDEWVLAQKICAGLIRDLRS